MWYARAHIDTHSQSKDKKIREFINANTTDSFILPKSFYFFKIKKQLTAFISLALRLVKTGTKIYFLFL